MFWGCVLKENKAYKTQTALEDLDYPVLHISNVALPRNAPNGKHFLLLSQGTKGSGASGAVENLTLATLVKDKVESVALDLYVNVSQQITLSVAGPTGAELHLSGFFEPQREEEDAEGMFMDGEEEEDISEEEEEEEVAAGPSSKKLNQSLKQAKQNALKNAVAADEEDEDEDEEDYDDEDEEDEEDEDESEEEPAPNRKQATPAAAPAKTAQTQQKQPEAAKPQAAAAKPAAAE